MRELLEKDADYEIILKDSLGGKIIVNGKYLDYKLANYSDLYFYCCEIDTEWQQGIKEDIYIVNIYRVLEIWQDNKRLYKKER